MAWSQDGDAGAPEAQISWQTRCARACAPFQRRRKTHPCTQVMSQRNFQRIFHSFDLRLFKCASHLLHMFEGKSKSMWDAPLALAPLSFSSNYWLLSPIFFFPPANSILLVSLEWMQGPSLTGLWASGWWLKGWFGPWGCLGGRTAGEFNIQERPRTHINSHNRPSAFYWYI